MVDVVLIWLNISLMKASSDGITCFVKVHAPMPVLYKGAELMHMKMPIKVCPISSIKNAPSCLEESVCFLSWIFLFCFDLQIYPSVDSIY